METAGVPPPASAARSERVIPAFKPPDILWYFGAFATAFATFEVITKIPDSQRDLWQLLLALAFFAAFAFTRKRHSVAAAPSRRRTIALCSPGRKSWAQILFGWRIIRITKQ